MNRYTVLQSQSADGTYARIGFHREPPNNFFYHLYSRPAYSITAGSPGSDLAGETAAALAASAIYFTR